MDRAGCTNKGTGAQISNKDDKNDSNSFRDCDERCPEIKVHTCKSDESVREGGAGVWGGYFWRGGGVRLPLLGREPVVAMARLPISLGKKSLIWTTPESAEVGMRGKKM